MRTSVPHQSTGTQRAPTCTPGNLEFGFRRPGPQFGATQGGSGDPGPLPAVVRVGRHHTDLSSFQRPGSRQSRRSTAFLSIESRSFPAASMRLLGGAGLRKIKMTPGNQKVWPEHCFHPQRLRNKWQTHRKRTTSVSQIYRKGSRICLTWRCRPFGRSTAWGHTKAQRSRAYPCGCLKLVQDTGGFTEPALALGCGTASLIVPSIQPTSHGALPRVIM
jgi:hypothetical protein